MSQHTHPTPPPDPLDELVERLIDCGGVLSQIVNHMVEFSASGRSAPDAPPIPEILRSLIRDSVQPIRRSRSKPDLRVAAAIVDEITEAICSEILMVPIEPSDDGDRRNGSGPVLIDFRTGRPRPRRRPG